jgi:enoyl-CoA hydratase
MSYEFVQVEMAEGYAIVTLNRPKANAVSFELITELGQAIAELESDKSVRCILITGAGERFFSGGADIPTLRKNLADPLKESGLLATGMKTIHAIESCSKPVVAVINGIAVGGGCEIALACHMRIAADTARFGQPEINLGIIPGWGGTHRLPRLIGESRAMDWLLTGRMVDAPEALQAGLVTKVVPHAQLMLEARELAQLLAEKPGVATRVTMRVVHECALYPERGVESEAKAFREAAASKDAAEGVAAFLEKREAKFTGE